MRSKGKARKLTKSERGETMDDETLNEHPPSPRQPAPAPLIQHSSPITTTTTESFSTDHQMELYHRQREHQHHQHQKHQKHRQHSPAPVYIPEDVVLPPEFELRESCMEEAGLGVFSLVDIPVGERFGPFAGMERPLVKDTQCAWEIVDADGKVRCWIDASEPGTGNWMKYVRSAPMFEEQNMVPVQIENKVYYKVIHPIPPGKELLVLKEAAFPDQEGIPIQLIEEKRFPCSDCEEVFRSKVALRRHQKYACKNSNAIFTALNQQFHHHQVHSANLKSDRDETADETKGDSIISSSHNSEDEEGECDRSEYRANRDFHCDKCPKSFHWKSNLLRHQNEHNDDHQFPCEHCDKIFSDPSNLQRHIRTQHIGARSHACPECGKTFATSSGLKQHTHIHSSIKPFICEVCLKSYTQFSNLCRHKRMHVDCRTQLKCNNCSQMFATVTSLNKHRRFCHGSQLLNNQIPASQSTTVPSVVRNGSCPVMTPNAALMGVGMLGTNNPLHPANLAHLWNANMHLTQQALLQNNLLGYPGADKTPLPGHPYFIGYPPMPAQSPLMASNFAKPHHAVKNGSGGTSPNGSINSTEDWLKHYTVSPSKRGLQLTGQHPTTVKRDLNEKAESEVSDGSDVSNVSTPTGSDLDSTSGSDLDSDSEGNGENKAHRKVAHRHGSNRNEPEPLMHQVSRNDRRVENRVAASEPMKAIASIAEKYFGGAHPENGLLKAQIRSNGHDVDNSIQRDARFRPDVSMRSLQQDSPFDLSKRRLEIIQQRSITHATGEEPLDLSLPRRKRVSSIANVPVHKSQSHSPLNHHDKATEPAKGVADLYTKPMPLVMPDPIYRVNGDMLPSKFMRLDYSHLFPNAAFQHLRKFEHYHSEKGLAKSGLSPPHRAYPGSVLYPSSGDKMIMRSKDRYTCKYCGKLFPRSANLTRHLRTHTGEQPYSCKYCDRSFSISSNLQRHVRNIHNKEKPFKCPLCERCFGQQTNLDRHLKKHENERAEEIALSTATEHDVLVAARLMAKTKSFKEPNDLNEKDESYFDEIKNFIDDAKEKEALRRKLIEMEATAAVIASKQVQSPSVCSSSTEVKEEEPRPEKMEDDKDVPENEEQSDVEEDKEMEDVDKEADGETEEAQQVEKEVNNSQEGEVSKTSSFNVQVSFPQEEEMSDSMNESEDLSDGEEVEKSPSVTSEEDPHMDEGTSDAGPAIYGLPKNTSVCATPCEESELPEVDVLREGRANLSRHSKLQAYSLMMALSDEEPRRGDGARRSLHSAHHTPVHTATPV